MKCLYLHTTTCALTDLENFIKSVFLTFVGASYMLGRALTSIIWGILADRIGRKPIIIITTFSMLVALFS
jgi:MFS family permease